MLTSQRASLPRVDQGLGDSLAEVLATEGASGRAVSSHGAAASK
jgi:hypothetical protein